ncbi:hypothetical protein [Aerosakkonema funiforme]
MTTIIRKNLKNIITQVVSYPKRSHYAGTEGKTGSSVQRCAKRLVF